jgi:hypothetical protein
LFDNLPFVEYNDVPGPLYGGLAMGDGDNDGMRDRLLERLEDLVFGDGVDGAGGFVEKQDGRPFEERAGDGDALALTAGEAGGAIAERCIQAQGKGANEGFQADAAQGLPEFFVGCGLFHAEG